MRCRLMTTVRCCVALAAAAAVGRPARRAARADHVGAARRYRPAGGGEGARPRRCCCRPARPRGASNWPRRRRRSWRRCKARNAARAAQAKAREPQGARRRLRARIAGDGAHDSAVGTDLDRRPRRRPRGAHRDPFAGCRRAARRAAVPATRSGSDACASRVPAPNADGVRPVPGQRDRRRIRSASAQFWSPVLDGDVATIEFHAGAGRRARRRDADTCRASRTRSSRTRELRFAVAPKTRAATSARRRAATSTSRASRRRAALANAAKAVAQLLFVGDDGNQLPVHRHAAQRLDRVQHAVPVHRGPLHRLRRVPRARSTRSGSSTRSRATATRCRRTCSRRAARRCSAAARTRTGRWCGSTRRRPPGALFAGMDARSRLPLDAITITLHHPQGDLKKWSQGTCSHGRSMSTTRRARHVQRGRLHAGHHRGRVERRRRC